MATGRKPAGAPASALTPFAVVATIDTARVAAVAERAADLRPVWLRDVQPIVTRYLAARFASEGRVGGPAWAPLRQVTKLLRQRPGHGRGGVGHDTGRLWASLVKNTGAAPIPNSTLVLDPQRYERGSTLKHAGLFSRGFRSVMKPVHYATEHGVGKNGRQRKPVRRWAFVRRTTPLLIPPRPIVPDPLPGLLVYQVREAVLRYVVGAPGTPTPAAGGAA